METVISDITRSLKSTFSPEVIAFLISLMPILELRGGLIASSILQIPWFRAYVICVVATILPMPLVFFFIKNIFEWMKKKHPKLRKLVEKLEIKAQKGGVKIQKYKKWGLFLFVAIPLPGTGAWTGTLAAALLEMKAKEALPAVVLGSMTAGILMILLGYVAPQLLKII